jgi:hypothetical protein
MRFMKRMLCLVTALVWLCSYPASLAAEGFTLNRSHNNSHRGAESRAFLHKENAEKEAYVVNQRFNKGKLLRHTKQKKVGLVKGTQKHSKSIAKVTPRKAQLNHARRPLIHEQIKRKRSDHLKW